jgi:O-acetylserine/cysteine efflux transporter
LSDIRGSLTAGHLALAIAVTAVWGTNFVVVKYGLDVLPPLTLATLRFMAVLLPMVFFVKRPAVSWSNLAAYGVLIGAGQFGALFVALRSDVTPGLASLLMQSQLFFTIGLSRILTGERVHWYQMVALVPAVAGLGVILMHTDGSITPLGLGLILVASLSWGGGNMVARAAGKVDMLGYVVWGSLFAIPPLFAMTLIFEGWPTMVAGVQRATLSTWAVVAWQAVGNTMFGYGVWGWLLARYPAATVSPLALMIPVFGMASSAVILGEPMQDWKLLAAVLVMSGLAFGVLWPRIAMRVRAMA